MRITDGDIERAREAGACEEGLAEAARLRRVEALSPRHREWVAEWLGARPEWLARLARDEAGEVRAAVARHPSTPARVLARLARDAEWYVRAAVAAHPGCPPRVLARLARDADAWVRVPAAQHPGCPPRMLALLARDEAGEVRAAVARHPSTTPRVLARLARDADAWVRAEVAGRPSMPPPHDSAWIDFAGCRATWRAVPRGGYGYVYRVPVRIVRCTARRAVIEELISGTRRVVDQRSLVDLQPPAGGAE